MRQGGTVSYAGWVADSIAGMYQINVKLPGTGGGPFADMNGAAVSAITRPVELPVVITSASRTSQIGVGLWALKTLKKVTRSSISTNHSSKLSIPSCAKNSTDLRSVIVGGDAILCASRVEPVVAPGQIWATAEFREQFLQRPSLWRTVPVAAASGEELYNVRKEATQEPDLWVRLYRLES